MAFKTPAREDAVPESPDLLFLQLPRRKIPNVLPHQQEIMRAYSEEALHQQDVALQLPTGSGKTLVGLLIGEWRRRKFRERVVYLCPTVQLVNQTVEQSDEKYGIGAIGFTGSARDYDAKNKSSYRNTEKIAVTTYSSLFNTNPYFSDADLIIIDDAHAAENYIAGMWSLRIDFKEPDHKPIQAALAGILRPHISKINYSRLVGNWKDSTDATWVDKVPTPLLHEIHDDLVEILDEHAEHSGLKYQWSTVRDHLSACHIYMSSRDILIRPLVPPTWDHLPFASAKQRLFMSATLGEGGDLERLTGRDKIYRVAIPKGWEQQGVGRRFFMFPGMSLDAKQTDALRLGLMQEAGRSLVLTPSQPACDAIADQVRTRLRYPVFSASDIEGSKQPFIRESKAVAAMANRYDGIDFPKEECRFLCVDGLPRATNSQEKFLMARMGANVLFNERVQTRVIQAIGRCTRSLEDYSAVYITGQELEDYLADPKRRKYFHPELQAEIWFGVEQSTEREAEDFLENFRTFIANSDDWEEVNNQIVSERAKLQRQPFPAMGDLGNAVGAEIAYQKHMWAEDFEAAMAEAETVLSRLGDPDLRGYRALWHYLAGSAAWLASQENVPGTADKARLHFAAAKKAANSIPWLISLARYQSEAPTSEEKDEAELSIQLENVEEVLEKFGVLHDRSFTRREKEILTGLESPDTFENAHKLLGELIGFSAGKVEIDASPDPWWLSSSTCFVFEDHANADANSVLGANKARQAASHPKWMEANVEASKGLDMLPVLVTPVRSATKGAMPHLDTVWLWPLDDFLVWARNAVAVVREQRRTFVESGDLAWRASAAKAFVENRMDAAGISKFLRQQSAAQLLAETDEVVE